MTKKIVIGISLCNDKCRSKALQIVVSIPGVQSAEIVRGGRERVVVVGDVDSVELTRRLRKKMGHAELMSVTDTATDKPTAPPPTPATAPPYYGSPHYHHYEVREPVCDTRPCFIL
ncbi:disease resistance protein Pik-1-like isoform X2 [Salvia hispanica]|uniref:disease resistance protein Pik-1-like isoform X2 n=1 Tax=Salvia hispanica TaxID=49212 RepID=UPI00200900AB|nr:disease resistance protein Pik-1-like isoform X2 [Salvia hispanica]